MEQKIVVSPERPLTKTIFRVEITNGYVFRQIFEVYERFVISGLPIFFKESGITIRTGTNSSRTNRKLISDVEIFTDDIIDYYIDENLVTIPTTENSECCHIEQLNISRLRLVFKSISKTSSLRMYKTTDSEDVFIDILGVTTEKSRISTNNYQQVEHDFSAFENISPTTNVKIEISQFCNSMKSMTRGDSDYTSFKVFPEGLVIEGRNNSGTIMRDGRWGKIKKEYDESDYVETKVNSSIVKALTKLNGMSMYSIVKIVSEQDGYLKIIHKIADFGEHNIYLIDTN